MIDGFAFTSFACAGFLLLLLVVAMVQNWLAGRPLLDSTPPPVAPVSPVILATCAECGRIAPVELMYLDWDGCFVCPATAYHAFISEHEL